MVAGKEAESMCFLKQGQKNYIYIYIYYTAFIHCRELGIGTIDGFADDYAYLIRGLLDLFEASQEERWLNWAWQLQEKMTELFWDKEGGGYFSATSTDPSILLRMKEGISLTVMWLCFSTSSVGYWKLCNKTSS